MSAPEKQMLQNLNQLVEAGFAAAVEDLISLVRIPSVAWPDQSPQPVEDSASRVAELFSDLNLFDRVRIVRAGGDGKPAVLAEKAALGNAPTIMLYAHHDVQPPGAEHLWKSPAFEPEERGGRLYGRGSADDKAGVILHLAALRILKATAEAAGEPLALGIRLFIEGEEEISSPSFEALVAEETEFFDVDVTIIADSDSPSTETPGLTTSLRGNLVLSMRLRTLEHASHSGIFGGAAPDATTALIILLSRLYDERGSLAIPGLAAEFNTPDTVLNEDSIREHAGLLPGVSLMGQGTISSRIWAQPTLTVIGIDAPPVATSSNTLQPEIKARLSFRLAPGQDANEAANLICEYLHARVPFGAQLEIYEADLGSPYRVPASGWAAQLMRSSLTASWPQPAVDLGLGGSIPMVPVLAERYPNMQMLLTGVEDPQTQAHSPNESLSLAVLKQGILAEARFLLEAGRRDQGRETS